MLFQESVEYPKCKTITDKYNHCDEYSYARSGLETAPEGNENRRNDNAQKRKNDKRYEKCPLLHVIFQKPPNIEPLKDSDRGGRQGDP